MDLETLRTATVRAIEALPIGEIEAWGTELADRLRAGHSLLVAGNGGSAAQAQHLAAELVGTFDRDRPPFSAIALSGDPTTLTALANDFGYDQTFARQVAAHGRAGDVLVCLSTSGRSSNILEAARAAAALQVTTFAFTGCTPNPLADAADQSIAVESTSPAVIQDAHQVAIHLLCHAFEATVGDLPSPEG